MFKKIMSMFISGVLVLSVSFVSEVSQAQADPSIEERAELSGTRKQMATIIFAGLAGAILGLSTLSFYGRPQDHLSNIAMGFALGVIGGAIFTTYKAATRPYEVYDISLQEDLFNDKKDLAFQQDQFKPSIGWRWEF